MRVDDLTFDEMKKWLGQGEMDVDLALRMGATTRDNVIGICRTLTDSPWYDAER